MVLSEFIFVNSFSFLRRGLAEPDLSEAVFGYPVDTRRAQVMNSYSLCRCKRHYPVIFEIKVAANHSILVKIQVAGPKITSDLSFVERL